MINAYHKTASLKSGTFVAKVELLLPLQARKKNIVGLEYLGSPFKTDLEARAAEVTLAEEWKDKNMPDESICWKN
jgi:hypothetical protein